MDADFISRSLSDFEDRLRVIEKNVSLLVFGAGDKYSPTSEENESVVLLNGCLDGGYSVMVQPLCSGCGIRIDDVYSYSHWCEEMRHLRYYCSSCGRKKKA